MTRSFAFLVNPAAGGGAAPAAVVPVAALLRRAGATVDVTYSPGPKASLELVRAAVADGAVVVAVGGDGMLGSLAGEVARAGGVLGLVPAGRGNDFARMIGVPADPEGQARLLLEAEPHAVDLLSWQGPGGEQLVAGSVYAGVDAHAAELVNRSRWVPRRLQYPLAALRSLATYRPGHYRLVVDGVASDHVAATVVVANSAFYGQGMRIAPGAEVTDGLLDIVVIGASSRRALMRALPTVYDGAHVDRDDVVCLRGRRIEISGTAAGPIPVGGDGEPLGVLPLLGAPPAVIEVRPAALQVLVDAPSV